MLPPGPDAVPLYAVDDKGPTLVLPEVPTHPTLVMYMLVALVVVQRNMVLPPYAMGEVSAQTEQVGVTGSVQVMVTVPVPPVPPY